MFVVQRTGEEFCGAHGTKLSVGVSAKEHYLLIFYNFPYSGQLSVLGCMYVDPHKQRDKTVYYYPSLNQ